MVLSLVDTFYSVSTGLDLNLSLHLFEKIRAKVCVPVLIFKMGQKIFVANAIVFHNT